MGKDDDGLWPYGSWRYDKPEPPSETPPLKGWVRSSRIEQSTARGDRVTFEVVVECSGTAAEIRAIQQRLMDHRLYDVRATTKRDEPWGFEWTTTTTASLK